MVGIVDELQYLDEAYFPFDKPVPFVGNLELHPVNVKYHDEFLACTACMTLNRMDDPEGLRYSNIGYLIHKMEDEKEGPMWSRYFSRLCELVFDITLVNKVEIKVIKIAEFLKTLTNPICVVNR